MDKLFLPSLSDCDTAFSKQEFRRYWISPKQMINRPWLSAWTLDVNNYDQLLRALKYAHNLGQVVTLSFTYANGAFYGTCVIPNECTNE